MMNNFRPAVATLAALTVTLAFGAESGVAGQLAQPKVSTANTTMSVTIVGSGGGPAVNLQRFGPSILVRAGNETLLFDCGRGATLHLAQLGVPLESVRQLFLTHLHSDHIIDIPDLLLTPWAGPAARQQSFEVWGPSGTEAMMRHLHEAFAFDIHVRRDVDEKFSKEGITVESHDIHEGAVFERNGVRVTAFLVDHGPVKPAFGYRVDYGNRSFAMSGDTRFSENLIKFARGVDLLIHEATAGDVNRRTNQTREQVEKTIAHHTPPERVGEVFSHVKPKLAIYAHAPVSDALIARTRTTYDGPLESGEDMMTIEIGATIQVRRFSQ